MKWNDLPEGGGILRFDDVNLTGLALELEVVVDLEEGLAWGVWWLGGFELIGIAPLVEA